MAELSFDDLIPQKPQKQELSFDDLIPKKSATVSIAESLAAGDNPYAGEQKHYAPIGPAGPGMLGAAAVGAGLGATAPFWGPAVPIVAPAVGPYAGSAAAGAAGAAATQAGAPDWLVQVFKDLALGSYAEGHRKREMNLHQTFSATAVFAW